MIALRLDIAKRITTHTGRRTFANLCLNGGLYASIFAPGARLLDTVLSKESTITMMGRTSAKGLEAYASPDERRIMQEFKKSA
ncbi:hypothetical protein FAES_3743 [Fibrella aestuarina BUZ 2]|uniref:Uncharacterized protein n=1 Tax=Fibrella aestuarina BUZ 2 TaxID=1166018 RepID=I0KC97_9BACT|nr:hypothetical protein [Fibrella aestuarina]CCH01750.1 hypothetical protein FAES_3743 [Fibrella aestuarina BUZ 2]